MSQISSKQLQIFFERFPLLKEVVTKLNNAKIPFAIGGSGCLFLLGNARLPDDVDIYLPNDRHDEADLLFGIASYQYQSPQENVRNSNPEGNHSIQLTSHLILKIGEREYDLAMTPENLVARIEVAYQNQRTFLYPPEDVLLIKALLQRGEDVGKHDISDIQNFLKIYSGLRMEYLRERIEALEAKDRVGKIFSNT